MLTDWLMLCVFKGGGGKVLAIAKSTAFIVVLWFGPQIKLERPQPASSS